MVPIKYEGDVYRPPSEANSLIIQATLGCSHNRCTFCSMYKEKKFRVHSIEKIKGDIESVKNLLPRTRRVFLADGNALAIPTEPFLQILQLLDEAFPNLERVSVYGNPQDLLAKSAAELSRLKAHKLGIVYLGVESGSSSILDFIDKGASPEDMALGAKRSKEAGIPLSVTVINGLAGVEGSEEHARETAALLNKMDPEYLGLLSLMPVAGTTINRQFEEGLLTALTPWQLLQEIRLMVEGLSLNDCLFRANHASNYLPLKATLSRDKKQLLEALDHIIHKKNPATLKSEFLRGI